MNPQELGAFIAERRKELNMTQAELSQKLHVTDKAISRWERGVGLPDINLLEPLAEALEVSLAELVRGKRSEHNRISLEEANQLVTNTVFLSKSDEDRRIIGSFILGIFGVICVFLLCLLIADGSIVVYSVGSIIMGLVAWGAPLWQITLSRANRCTVPGIISLGAALTSLAIQFFELAHKVDIGDFSAIEDTIHALCHVVVTFSVITLMLNLWMIWHNRRK